MKIDPRALAPRPTPTRRRDDDGPSFSGSVAQALERARIEPRPKLPPKPATPPPDVEHDDDREKDHDKKGARAALLQPRALSARIASERRAEGLSPKNAFETAFDLSTLGDSLPAPRGESELGSVALLFGAGADRGATDTLASAIGRAAHDARRGASLERGAGPALSMPIAESGTFDTKALSSSSLDAADALGTGEASLPIGDDVESGSMLVETLEAQGPSKEAKADGASKTSGSTESTTRTDARVTHASSSRGEHGTSEGRGESESGRGDSGRGESRVERGIGGVRGDVLDPSMAGGQFAQTLASTVRTSMRVVTAESAAAPTTSRFVTEDGTPVTVSPLGRDHALLTLEHPTLGLLEVEIKLGGEGVDVELLTQSSSGAIALRDSEGALRDSLADKGNALRSFRVRTKRDGGQREGGQREGGQSSGAVGEISASRRRAGLADIDTLDDELFETIPTLPRR